jgi:hypothetical protein
MNRRSFFSRLAGSLLAAPAIVLGVPAETEADLKRRHPIMVIRHPVRVYEDRNGDVRSAQEIAQGLLEEVKPGGAFILPNTRDSYGQYEWDVRAIGGEAMPTKRVSL